MSPAAVGTVALVCHAETDWALSGRHTRRTDGPPTDAGRDRARAISDKLRAGRSTAC